MWKYSKLWFRTNTSSWFYFWYDYDNDSYVTYRCYKADNNNMENIIDQTPIPNHVESKKSVKIV